MPTLRFYFDYISPYAYIAWTQIHALAAECGYEVEAIPVLFAGLLNHHGQLGPAEIPAKRVYIFKDVMRTAATLNIPLTPPPTHPFNPLYALRLTGSDMPTDTRNQLIHKLYQATWGEGSGITDPDHVDAIAAEVGLTDSRQRATMMDAKARLRAATEGAIADGVFGVPTMIAGGELFWGYDSFEHLRRSLMGKDPLPDDALAKVAHIKASASRIKR